MARRPFTGEKFIKLNFQRRLTIAVIFISLLLLTLLARLFYLQLLNYGRFNTQSINNRINVVSITPARGLIYDRKGILIAENQPAFSLDITPYKILNLATTLEQLKILFNLSSEQMALFHRRLKQYHHYNKIPLKEKLTKEDIAYFSVNQYRFPGVEITAHLIRYYPYANDLVDVLGYVGRINEEDLKKIDTGNYAASHYIGKRGIEKYFEKELHGQTGYHQVEVNALGQVIRTVDTTAAMSGNNLYLTIDTDLQKKALTSFGDSKGSLVALNPKNGDILAMVSTPGYDPNLFVTGISQKAYNALQNSPDKPLFNRALGLYPPGSTIKPFIALEGLTTGTITVNESIYDPGYFQLGPSMRRFRNWKRTGQGRVNITRAITISNDTYFYWLGNKLGIKKISTVENEIGFGQKTGIQLPNEPNGIVPTPEYKHQLTGEPWYPGDTLNTVIGQGYTLVTPLQLAVATSIIANRGIHYRPSLIDKITTPDGKVIQHKAEKINQLDIASTIWEIVIKSMVDVIISPRGTGHRFGKPPYSVAAKTGTAQLFTVKESEHYNPVTTPIQLRDNSMFIAFAPVDDPQIVIAVAVENDPAAPRIAREVMDYYLLEQGHWQTIADTPLIS